MSGFENFPEAHRRVGIQVFGTLVVAKSIKTMVEFSDELETYFIKVVHPMIENDQSGELITLAHSVKTALKLANSHMLQSNAAFERLHNAMDAWRLD